MSEKYVWEVFPELPDHLPLTRFLKSLKLDTANNATMGDCIFGFMRGRNKDILIYLILAKDRFFTGYIFISYEDGFEIFTQESKRVPDEIKKLLPADGCHNCKKLCVRTTASNFICPFGHIICKRCRNGFLWFGTIKDNDCLECIWNGNNVLQ